MALVKSDVIEDIADDILKKWGTKMNLLNKQYRTSDNNIINYYEIENSNPVLLIIHAQGTNAISYAKVVKELSKKFHIILVWPHRNSTKYNWYGNKIIVNRCSKRLYTLFK